MSITILNGNGVEMRSWGETSTGLWRGSDVLLDIYSCCSGERLDEVVWLHCLEGMTYLSQ